MAHWLIKSEPSAYSIDDLERDGRTRWDGVRNYQARNFMTDAMTVGDRVLFYHSNAKPPGVAGLARITAAAAPDATQFKRGSDYFEPRATPDKPVWFSVEIGFETKFSTLIGLDELRDRSALKEMALLRKGQRLSIQPVTPVEFKCILALRRR